MELDRDCTRPRTRHCRENMTIAGRRLKNGNSEKKAYSCVFEWRKQSWSEAELVLLGKFGKIVKWGGNEVEFGKIVKWGGMKYGTKGGMEREDRK